MVLPLGGPVEPHLAIWAPDTLVASPVRPIVAYQQELRLSARLLIGRDAFPLLLASGASPIVAYQQELMYGQR